MRWYGKIWLIQRLSASSSMWFAVYSALLGMANSLRNSFCMSKSLLFVINSTPLFLSSSPLIWLFPLKFSFICLFCCLNVKRTYRSFVSLRLLMKASFLVVLIRWVDNMTISDKIMFDCSYSLAFCANARYSIEACLFSLLPRDCSRRKGHFGLFLGSSFANLFTFGFVVFSPFLFSRVPSIVIGCFS